MATTQGTRKRTTGTGAIDSGIDTQPAPEPIKRKTIIFKDREIEVQPPTAEQIMAWERILLNLEVAAKQGTDIDRVNATRKILSRFNSIIEYVMVHELDREWLEDQYLMGTTSFTESMRIVIDTLEAYKNEIAGTPPNRAARRTRPIKSEA